MSELKTVHIDGFNHTFHPMPEGYTPGEWTHMCKCYHTSKGRIVRDVLASVEHEYDDLGNTLYRTVTKETYGMEVTWTV